MIVAHSIRPRLDVMCIADLCVDIILTGNVRPRFGQIEQLIDDYTIELGGSATIFAGQFTKVGGTAGILGVVGEDLFGEFILRRLGEQGLNTDRVRIDPGVRTGVGFTLVESHDRAILTYSGALDGIEPSELTDDLIAVSRHWHVASYFLLNRLRPHWARWLARLKKAGVTLSLDPNWSTDGKWADIRELLPLIDVFFANENEAVAIAECRDVARAGRLLAQQGPMVVIKQDERGATAFHQWETWHAPAHDVVRGKHIVDTVGAGDCFDAGFIRAWQLGRPMDDCLELACRCGRANLSAAGGFNGQLREHTHDPKRVPQSIG